MQYVIIDRTDDWADPPEPEVIDIDAPGGLEAALAAMAEAGIASLPVWVCPYDTIEDAEAAGWVGASRSGRRLFA